MQEAPVSADRSQPAVVRDRVWDTRDVEARETFGYYREGICEAFMELVPEIEASMTGRFGARVEHIDLGGGAVNRVRATAHQVNRTRREIARSPGECFYLNYQTDGICDIEQAGRRLELRAGEVGIFSSGQPFVLEHRRRPQLGVASFFVPTGLLGGRLPGSLPRGPAVLSDDPAIGRLLSETARSLSSGADALSAPDRARLFDMLVDLAAMALGGTRAAIDPVATRADATYLRLKRIVAERLRDPGLDVAGAARAAGISPRYLHRLFERQGASFTAYLLGERLLLASARLADPRWSHLPIATIAYDCGFRDLSHFGRAFKARFAATPGEWRRGEAGPS